MTPEEYVASPPTTDPAAIIREKNIAIRWLLEQLADREAALADRERSITDLLAEIAGVDS